MAIFGVLGGLLIFNPKPLLKNGELSMNFEGWETNAGLGIFHDPAPRDWRHYWKLVRTGGILHLADLHNDHFAALGAGNTVGSVLSQTVALNGKSGRYGLSFLFAATGDAGTVAVIETSVMDTNGTFLLHEMLTNSQPVKTYYVPRKQERMVKFAFDVPTGTGFVKLSFADKSPNRGIAVDPLIKNVTLKKLN